MTNLIRVKPEKLALRIQQWGFIMPQFLFYFDYHSKNPVILWSWRNPLASLSTVSDTESGVFASLEMELL